MRRFTNQSSWFQLFLLDPSISYNCSKALVQTGNGTQCEAFRLTTHKASYRLFQVGESDLLKQWAIYWITLWLLVGWQIIWAGATLMLKELRCDQNVSSLVFRFRKLPWTNDASAELNTTICSQSLYSLFLYTGSMMKALEGCVIRVWYSFYSCINGCFSWIHPPPSSRFGMAVCWLFHMHEGGGES